MQLATGVNEAATSGLTVVPRRERRATLPAGVRDKYAVTAKDLSKAGRSFTNGAALRRIPSPSGEGGEPISTPSAFPPPAPDPRELHHPALARLQMHPPESRNSRGAPLPFTYNSTTSSSSLASAFLLPITHRNVHLHPANVEKEPDCSVWTMIVTDR